MLLYSVELRDRGTIGSRELFPGSIGVVVEWRWDRNNPSEQRVTAMLRK
jgi:hypothetical protein